MIRSGKDIACIAGIRDNETIKRQCLVSERVSLWGSLQKSSCVKGPKKGPSGEQESENK